MEDKTRLILDMKYLIIIAILGCMFSVTSCAKKENPKPEAPKQEMEAETPAQDSVQHKVLSFNLEGLDNKGAKKWDVKGESAEAVSESEIRLNNIVAKAYGGEAEATITADQGVYDKTKNNVRLEKNVKATIESTQVFAETFVDVSNQWPEDSKSKKANNKEKTVITCDGEVEFNYEKNQAYFNKNVLVVGEAGSINADKITINLDPATRKVKDINAEKNVVIKKDDNVTYSEKATYTEEDKKVVLSGNPKVVIYQEGGVADKLLGK